MNIKVISRNVGFALLVSALFMLLSVGVSMANGNDSALAALLISFTITFIAGVFPFIFVRRAPAITPRDGYMIIFLSWVLSFIFGMLPYVLWGGPFSVINAWFESVSGFTTTGATILERVEDLPKSLLFWRSSTHFIGGLGVVVFLLLIIPHSNPVRLRLSNMEISSLSKEGYRARANKTVHIFTYVYIGIGLAAFLAYMLAGMSPFDAINHAFSVCATGGFSTRSLSIAAFDSLPVTLVTMFFMFAASVHFGMIFMVVVTRSLKPLKNAVLKFYAGTLVAASLLIMFSLKLNGLAGTWGQALLNGAFHVLSYASTTGFAIADNSMWPLMPSMLLMVFGIQCGMAGSTTGGLKSDRVLLLIMAIKAQIANTIHPSHVTEIKLGGRSLKYEEIAPHILYVAMYFVVMIISLLVCLMAGGDNDNALIGTLSSLGNVGPAVGELGTFGNYNMEPVFAKFMYTVDMLLGRLEIYPVLAVFSMVFGKSGK